MAARHSSRRHALQVLYQWDLRRIPIDEAISAFYGSLSSGEDVPTRGEPDPFMEELVRGALSHIEELDRRIVENSSNWRLDRMPVVDRNLLRIAAYEMLWVKTPAPIVIDEAVELARQFSGDEAVKFVNAVLDAIRRAEPAASI